MDGALALGGRRSLMKNNNQLGAFVRSGRDVGDEARGVRSCGGTLSRRVGQWLEQHKNK